MSFGYWTEGGVSASAIVAGPRPGRGKGKGGGGWSGGRGWGKGGKKSQVGITYTSDEGSLSAAGNTIALPADSAESHFYVFDAKNSALVTTGITDGTLDMMSENSAGLGTSVASATAGLSIPPASATTVEIHGYLRATASREATAKTAIFGHGFTEDANAGRVRIGMQQTAADRTNYTITPDSGTWTAGTYKVFHVTHRGNTSVSVASGTITSGTSLELTAPNNAVRLDLMLWGVRCGTLGANVFVRLRSGGANVGITSMIVTNGGTHANNTDSRALKGQATAATTDDVGGVLTVHNIQAADGIRPFYSSRSVTANVGTAVKYGYTTAVEALDGVLIAADQTFTAGNYYAIWTINP